MFICVIIVKFLPLWTLSPLNNFSLCKIVCSLASPDKGERSGGWNYGLGGQDRPIFESRLCHLKTVTLGKSLNPSEVQPHLWNSWNALMYFSVIVSKTMNTIKPFMIESCKAHTLDFWEKYMILACHFICF